MAETFTEEAPPPSELVLAWQCERWHCLPESGALLDQDYRLIKIMADLDTIHRVISRWHNLTGTRIHQLTTHDRKILKYLLDNGIQFNAMG